MRPGRSCAPPTKPSRVSNWTWEPHPDTLLDGLPPEARQELDQLAREITVRDSMVYLDGKSYEGPTPGHDVPAIELILNDARTASSMATQIVTLTSQHFATFYARAR